MRASIPLSRRRPFSEIRIRSAGGIRSARNLFVLHVPLATLSFNASTAMLDLKPTHKPVQNFYSALQQFENLGVSRMGNSPPRRFPPREDGARHFLFASTRCVNVKSRSEAHP
jgi:hypothetical protein